MDREAEGPRRERAPVGAGSASQGAHMETQQRLYGRGALTKQVTARKTRGQQAGRRWPEEPCLSRMGTAAGTESRERRRGKLGRPAELQLSRMGPTAGRKGRKRRGEELGKPAEPRLSRMGPAAGKEGRERRGGELGKPAKAGHRRRRAPRQRRRSPPHWHAQRAQLRRGKARGRKLMGQPSRGWPRASRGAARLTGADRRTSGWRNAADGGREERPAEGRQRRIRKDWSGGGPPGICKGDQPLRGWPEARGGAARRAATQRRHSSPQATSGGKGGPWPARGRPRRPGGGGSREVGRR